MKKKWKVFWMICASMSVIGIACIVIAFGMGVTLETLENRFPNGISIGKSDAESSSESTDEEWKNHLSNTYDGITELDIDLSAGELEIFVSDNESIVVETEGLSRKLDFQCYRDENELVMKTEKNLTGIVNQSLGTVYIYLPEDFCFDKVSINVHAGTLYIEKILADELSIDVGAGEAQVCYFVAEEADFDCGAGEMTVCGDVDKFIDIDCGLGQIVCRIDDYEDQFNYKLTCGVGEIVCGTNSYSGIGSDQKVENNAGKEMDIDCGVGEVTVEFEEYHTEEHKEHKEHEEFQESEEQHF